MRRVVTGHDAAERAVFASDENVAPFEIAMPNVDVWDMWGSDTPMSFPDKGERPASDSLFPPPGGFRYFMTRLRPGANTTPDAEADPDSIEARRGMHRTESVDILFIHKGRCILELDDGRTLTLSAGDSIVQSGTMHAWSNPFDEECIFASVMIGCEHKMSVEARAHDM